MLKELFRPGAPFPTNRQEGVAYAEELVGGIKLWAKIDVVVMPLAILLWALGVIPAILLGLAVLFAVAWVLAFFVLHVTSVAIHTLIIAAAAAALLHFIRPRRSWGPHEALPKDAVK